MPRQARKESGTGIYHVMMRGIIRQAISKTIAPSRHRNNCSIFFQKSKNRFLIKNVLLYHSPGAIFVVKNISVSLCQMFDIACRDGVRPNHGNRNNYTNICYLKMMKLESWMRRALNAPVAIVLDVRRKS